MKKTKEVKRIKLIENYKKKKQLLDLRFLALKIDKQILSAFQLGTPPIIRIK